MTDTLPVVRVHAAADLHAKAAQARTRDQRGRIAASPWLTPELANRLARSTHYTLRARVADNPATPAKILARLTTDPVLSIQVAAANNPSCPLDAALAAANAGNFDILDHPHCPAARLTAALTRKDRAPKYRVAPHPNVPDDLRRRLLATGHPSTQRAALQHPASSHDDYLAVIATCSDEQERLVTWRWEEHPNADPAWLADTADRFWDDHDQAHIAHIARNPATPQHVLHRIATEHVHAAYALANPNCDPHTLRTVAVAPTFADFTRSSRRRSAVGVHANTPLDVLDQLISDDVTSNMYDFVLAHARTADQATALLALLPQYKGPLGQVVAATATAADRTPAAT